MVVAGIIAEYNPIHKGHTYHISETREKTEADIIVAVMSGNFMQRGEPAILDKWTRAGLAVEEGIDLCLELPVHFSCNSAEKFAEGGVKIMEALGVVDYISFGTEASDPEELFSLAKLLAYEPVEFSEKLKEYLNEGFSFPKSRELALKKMEINNAEIIGMPNNILAIEYMKWLHRINSNIKPINIPRIGLGHNESATTIRKIIEGKDFDRIKNLVGNETCKTIEAEKKFLVDSNNERLFDLIKYTFLSKPVEELNKVFGVAEGIENKIIQSIRKTRNLDELVDVLKSKRYTRTRINRILMQSLIGITKDSYEKNQKNLYTRVLAFNNKGSELLRYIKNENKCSIPIINKISKGMEEKYFEIPSTDIYNIISGRDTYEYSDYIKKPINKCAINISSKKTSNNSKCKKL